MVVDSQIDALRLKLEFGESVCECALCTKNSVISETLSCIYVYTKINTERIHKAAAATDADALLVAVVEKIRHATQDFNFIEMFGCLQSCCRSCWFLLFWGGKPQGILSIYLFFQKISNTLLKV